MISAVEPLKKVPVLKKASTKKFLKILVPLIIIGVIVAVAYSQIQTPSPSPTPSPNLNFNVIASSWQNSSLTPNNAFDGNLATRWASIPQEDPLPWLEIDFAAPQNISTVRIYFEKALGVEYKISTWNGDSWVTQITEANNTSLTPEYHFAQVTSTTKLRLTFSGYFSGYMPWDLVSIWEITINP